MDVCSDFVSPIEQHWNEASALRDSRTRQLLAQTVSPYYGFDSGTASNVLLRRHRNRVNAERLSSRNSSRPSSDFFESSRSRSRSRNDSSSISNDVFIAGSRDENRGASGTPVCVAPPDILPIYEQKQLFAAAAINSRTTSSSRPTNISPSLHPSTSNNLTLTNRQRNPNLHELTRLKATNAQRTTVSTNISYNVNQVSGGDLTAGTSASSINSLLSTAEKSPGFTRRDSDKPVRRIECKPNQAEFSGLKSRGLKPIVHRTTPIVARKNVPFDGRVNQQKISLRSHLSNTASSGQRSSPREILEQRVTSSGYNFRAVVGAKPYPVIFDSDTASTISDEFFVPFKIGNVFAQQNRPQTTTKRFIRSQDVVIGALSNECSLEFRIPKFYSKEIADWSISASYQQNRKCCEFTRKTRNVGRVINFASERILEGVKHEDLDSILISPRKLYANIIAGEQASDLKSRISFSCVKQEQLNVREPRRIKETNLDFSSETKDDVVPPELSSGDIFVSDQDIKDNKIRCQLAKIVSSSEEGVNRSDSDDVLFNCKDQDFNGVLVMQLFNLIGRLTEEMKQLETDCVEMRAELTELKLKSNQASPVCQRCVSAKIEANIDSQTIDHQSSEQNRAKGRPSGDHCSVPYIPLDIMREVQIPIALTRTVKEKRKKTIREKVFGLGRVTRSKRSGSLSLYNKSRSSFDGDECNDFSIGLRPSQAETAEPIYDIPPFEHDEGFKTEFAKQLRSRDLNARSSVEGRLERDDQIGLKREEIKRIQSEGRRLWQECSRLREGRFDGKSGQFEGGVNATKSSQEKSDCMLERETMSGLSQQGMEFESSKKNFLDWSKRMEKSEALLLDDDVDGPPPPPPVRFLTPPPRRATKPPGNLNVQSTEVGSRDAYDNWMEFKSTKAPRLSPESGLDLKVRFDSNIREKTYFKDEKPKLSANKPGSKLKLRMHKRLRYAASSLANKVKRSSRGTRLLSTESGEYEDLDFLDEKVSRLAEQSNQLCRNLTFEAQSGLRFQTSADLQEDLDVPLRSAADDDPVRSYGTGTKSTENGSPTNALYIDLSKYGVAPENEAEVEMELLEGEQTEDDELEEEGKENIPFQEITDHKKGTTKLV
ncbi:uncharacterized protein LOC134843773 isoform X2 [Symsagittifera roscoffensis]|uniref:uncharacterized protein LOC134843773 isoform X2 n=1 Tax=Symsagittifera roscoffensis TaxID=84072 RepID=UPI00307C3A8C